ncbi:MAG: hypothetical protein WA005_03305 [Candidatus Binataceae bacterium]
MFDADDFFNKAKGAVKGAVQARYARASLILSVAAIEAISNDALASIYELLTDICPSECVHLAPWVHFRRVSYRPIERLLLRQRSLAKKIQYIFRHLRRLSTSPDADLDKIKKQLKEAVLFRNRIVHMTYLLRPNRHQAVLNPRQIVSLAESALEAAKSYIGEIGYTFEEVNLPVSTAIESTSFPPYWWENDEWG